jgi:F0F1-type ATP synthase delta subunit
MQSKAKTYAAIMVEAFDGLSEKEAAKKVQSVKQLLYKRGDFKMLSKILYEFSRAWRERNGKTATAITAEPLSGKAQKDVRNALEKKGYVAEEKIEPNVLGGMALFLGNNFLIDGTIRGKLKRISNSIHYNG